MLFLVGFGWAKPVPVNFGYIRNTRLGLILVSSAGIIANMIGAFCALFILEIFAPQSEALRMMLNYFALINIILAAFNLIPIPPLDGSKILMGFMPENLQESMARFEPYGFFVIIGLLFLGVLNPLIAAFRWIIISIIRIFLPV
jgi:Zn-dependent protease